MSMDDNCQSCGAPIFWVKTVNDKNMPLDQKSTKGFVLADEGELAVAKMVNVYQTHYGSCPDAKAWSKGTKTRKV